MQLFRCKQAGRKVARFLCAVWLSCILVATGASADVTIRGKQVWRNQKKTLSENIVIEKGASLTLEGSTLHFKCTKPKQYGIVVNPGARLVIRKGSVVRGETPINGAFIHADDDSSRELRHVEARDSSFINMGSTIRDFYRNAWGPKGVRLRYTDSTSGFWNCTFDGGPSIGVMRVSGLRIEGNTFRYKKQKDSVCGSAVFLAHCKRVFVHRNTFECIGFPIYTLCTHDVRITNNVLRNCCYPYVERGGYAINIWGKPEHDLYIAFNKLINAEKNIVLNGHIYDTLLEYNSIDAGENACGEGLGMGNINNSQIIIRHCRVDHSRGAAGIGPNPRAGKGIKRFLMYDNRIAGATGSGLIAFGLDLVFSDISFVPANEGRNVGLAAIMSTKGIHCERTLFRNLSFSKYKTGIRLQGARDCVFCDIRLDKIKKTHVQFDGGNSNLKIINLKFDSGRASFKDGKDIFQPYWYADVKVTDADGKPVQGAKVTVTNEVDAAVGAINRKGEAVMNFTTGKNGHTPRPARPMKYAVTSKAFALKPDKPYKFAGWLRAKGGSGKKNDKSYVKAYAILYELDKEGKPIAGHPLYVRGKSKWVLRKDSFTTLPQTRQGKVELFVYGWGDHAAWFDDLSVKVKGGRNLLANPGFEGKPGDRGGWSPMDGHEGIWDGARKHSGSRSCKLVCRTWAPEDAGTMALCGYSQNKAGKTNYTYTITATKGNLHGSKTGVKPDANWYRADPTKPPVTIHVTLK